MFLLEELDHNISRTLLMSRVSSLPSLKVSNQCMTEIRLSKFKSNLLIIVNLNHNGKIKKEILQISKTKYWQQILS